MRFGLTWVIYQRQKKVANLFVAFIWKACHFFVILPHLKICAAVLQISLLPDWCYSDCPGKPKTLNTGQTNKQTNILPHSRCFPNYLIWLLCNSDMISVNNIFQTELTYEAVCGQTSITHSRQHIIVRHYLLHSKSSKDKGINTAAGSLTQRVGTFTTFLSGEDPP